MASMSEILKKGKEHFDKGVDNTIALGKRAGKAAVDGVEAVADVTNSG
jgi:hypothetical protein